MKWMFGRKFRGEELQGVEKGKVYNIVPPANIEPAIIHPAMKG